jgi:hypothetical protein
MNNQTQEALARWWAGKLGDVVCVDAHSEFAYHATSSEKWSTPKAYLSDMNVARRALEWAAAKSDRRSMRYLDYRLLACAISTFRSTAWSDTPAALLELARACGFDPENMDKNNE